MVSVFEAMGSNTENADAVSPITNRAISISIQVAPPNLKLLTCAIRRTIQRLLAFLVTSANISDVPLAGSQRLAPSQFIWTARPDGYVDFCNDWFQEYAGISPEECLGAGCRQIMPLHELDQSAERWRKAQKTGDAYLAQVHFRKDADGSYQAHQIRLYPLRNASGEVFKWVGAARAD